MSKPILVLDFDGVIHSYNSGWKGADIIPDGPVHGAMAAICEYIDYFDVHILSSRSNQLGGIDAMKNWLYTCLVNYLHNANAAQLVVDTIKWPTEKPPALLTIDDRAICFNGNWPTINDIQTFKPWSKK